MPSGSFAKFVDFFGQIHGRGSYLAWRGSWCPLPTRDHKTSVSLNQSLHQLAATTLFLCSNPLLNYNATFRLCYTAFHFQVHWERILMELLNQRESQWWWWVADMWLSEPPPHMTTFARLSPISNSHPFDFLTPPPHTMSKQTHA